MRVSGAVQRETGRVREEKSPGEAGMQSEPERSPPTPPLGPSPFCRGDKGQTPVHAAATFQPSTRARGSSGPPLGVGEGRRARPAPRCRPPPPLTIFLPVLAGPPPCELSGPFKNGSAAASLPASASAGLTRPHLTTRPLRPARDGGRREARPKLLRNSYAGVRPACSGSKFLTPVTKE